jgi:hypothetical protein
VPNTFTGAPLALGVVDVVDNMNDSRVDCIWAPRTQNTSTFLCSKFFESGAKLPFFNSAENARRDLRTIDS